MLTNSIKKHLFLHFAFLSLLRLKNSTYDCLYKITHYKHYHLIHTISLLTLLYLTNKKTIHHFLGSITSEEESSVNENLLYYLTDVILIISIFTSSFSITNFIQFVVVINFKIVNWILDIRSRLSDDKNIIKLCLLLLFLLIPSFLISFFQSISKPNIQILFCYEFFLVIISVIKNVCNVLLNIYLVKLENTCENEDQIENTKLIYGLIIEVSYIVSKLLSILVFFIYTTLNLRIPFNVLREFIKGVSILCSRLRNWYKLISLLKLIKNCKVVQGNCPICREDMEMGREIWCGHSFHSTCIKKWAEKQMQCPVCRKEIMTKDDGIPVQVIE